jgi:hypothetical protein
MRRAILAFLIALLAVTSALAQQAADPDYSVFVTNRSITSDGNTLILQFSVNNIGSAAAERVTARLFVETGDEQLIEEQTLRALGSNDSDTLTFNIDLATIPDGIVDFRLEVGIGEIEDEDSPTVDNNIARVGYIIPTAAAPRPTRQPLPTSTPVEGSASGVEPTIAPTATPTIELPFGIDLGNLDRTNPLLIGGIIAALGAALILLWVITIILRLLFRPPRIFDVWTPPYATVRMQDSNTLAGRRQLWQQSAQSDTMSAPCIEGQYHIRKHLIGVDGNNLSGWRVRGLRLSQYDIYGRIARSQTMASKGHVRRLDRASKRSAALSETDAQRAVRPIAKQLARDFQRNLHKRGVSLPIALDIRFRGAHGEVKIVFELYQCAAGTLQQVDRWEPEMTVVTGAIQENYTYSLQGMRQNENMRLFRQRLESDLEQTLKAMVYKPVPKEVSSDTSPSQPIPVTLATPSQPPAGETQVTTLPPPPPPPQPLIIPPDDIDAPP